LFSKNPFSKDTMRIGGVLSSGQRYCGGGKAGLERGGRRFPCRGSGKGVAACFFFLLEKGRRQRVQLVSILERDWEKKKAQWLHKLLLGRGETADGVHSRGRWRGEALFAKKEKKKTAIFKKPKKKCGGPSWGERGGKTSAHAAGEEISHETSGRNSSSSDRNFSNQTDGIRCLQGEKNRAVRPRKKKRTFPPDNQSSREVPHQGKHSLTGERSTLGTCEGHLFEGRSLPEGETAWIIGV